MQATLRFLAITIGFVAALEILIFAVAFASLDLRGQLVLSEDWIVSHGKIVAVDRGNHLSITVRYSAGSTVIERAFQGSDKNIGDGVDVYYYPENPHVAAIRNPANSVHNEVRVLLYAGLVFGLFLSFVVQFSALGTALAWPLGGFRITPRIAMVWIAVAVLIGMSASSVSSHNEIRSWLSKLLVVCGTAFGVRQAFKSSDISWSTFVKSRPFIIGLILVLIGQAVGLAKG